MFYEIVYQFWWLVILVPVDCVETLDSRDRSKKNWGQAEISEPTVVKSR
jgi:hypothetical protein